MKLVVHIVSKNREFPLSSSFNCNATDSYFIISTTDLTL